MKILIINSVYGVGSTGRICKEIAEKYREEGHEVKIACGRTYLSDVEDNVIQIGTKVDFLFHVLKTRIWDRHGFYSQKATNDFIEKAEEFSPDLVWLHNIHGYYINIERLFSWLKSKQNIEIKWTLHDCWAFTGHCAYFTYANCEQWKTHCISCSQRKEYPASYFFDHSKRNYEKKKSLFSGLNNLSIIVPSMWLKELVQESFLRDYPVEVKYNEIDNAIFKKTDSEFRKKYGLENKKVILGVASVWDRRKGLEDFYKLREELNEAYTIVLVGLNRKQLKKVPTGVIGLTRTKNARELAEWYSMADVFFNPTYEDNYPTVNLEAQACGTTVITYDAGGSVETLYNKNSFSVSVGNLDEVIKIIRNTCESGCRI